MLMALHGIGSPLQSPAEAELALDRSSGTMHACAEPSSVAAPKSAMI
jgi:hypothetical protein